MVHPSDQVTQRIILKIVGFQVDLSGFAIHNGDAVALEDLYDVISSEALFSNHKGVGQKYDANVFSSELHKRTEPCSFKPKIAILFALKQAKSRSTPKLDVPSEMTHFY